jgi:phage protein U
MLAMLKKQIFEIGQTDFQTLEWQIATKWARHQRVQGKVHHVPLGSSEEFIRIGGKLVMKDDLALEELKDYAKEQKPVLFTLGSGFAYWVVLANMETQEEKFTTEGASRIKHFTVQMERFYYDE